MRSDHANALEALASRYGKSPLSVQEEFLERAFHRQHAGMSREYAEAEAVRDVEQWLAGRAA